MQSRIFKEHSLLCKHSTASAYQQMPVQRHDSGHCNDTSLGQSQQSAEMATFAWLVTKDPLYNSDGQWSSEELTFQVLHDPSSSPSRRTCSKFQLEVYEGGSCKGEKGRTRKEHRASWMDYWEERGQRGEVVSGYWFQGNFRSLFIPLGSKRVKLAGHPSWHCDCSRTFSNCLLQLNGACTSELRMLW